jgi:hypothetical protein
MKKCRRTIHATLVVGLLIAALPVAAQPGTRGGQTTFGIFAKIEAVVAKLWPFTAPQPSRGDSNLERVRTVAKLGIDTSVGGVALPTEDDTSPPESGGSPSSQGG